MEQFSSYKREESYVKDDVSMHPVTRLQISHTSYHDS